MAFPGSLDTFTTKVDLVDNILAAHVNTLQTAVVAVETELGTDPAGSMTDLKTRLAVAVNDNGTLKNQSAALLTSGTVATARLGSGAASSTTFLRGDSTWATPAGGSGLVLPAIGTLVPPVDAGFAWINQGGGPDSSVVTNTDGSVTLKANAVAGANLRIRKKALAYTAAGPWMATLGFVPNLVFNSTFPSCGLLLRESATSKIVLAAYTKDGATNTPKVRLQKWDSATSFNAGYLSDWEDSAFIYTGQVLFLGIDLDNASSTLHFYVSNDGIYYTKIYEKAKNNFFTTGPDEVGYFALSNTSGAAAVVEAVHFVEYNDWLSNLSAVKGL